MRVTLILSVVFVMLSFSLPVHADATATKAEARRHFQAGLALASKGDFLGAVDAFETAYATSPHYLVLYNLGQAYAALGRSERAVKVLEQFLADGNKGIAPSRREEVEKLIARERGRLGRLDLAVTPPGAEAFLNGKPLGNGPFEPMDLTLGRHVVGARMTGFLPRAEVVEVVAGGSTSVSISLEPILKEVGTGFLDVRCRVPSVEVWVDGARRASTPLGAPLPVPEGERKVRFARDGYSAKARTVNVEVGRVTVVDCSLVRDPRIANAGTLKVRTNPPVARVAVDGFPYSGAALPAGPHVILVESDGFRPWQSLVSVPPKAEREIVVVLEEAPGRLRERAADRQRRRTWAAGVGLGGLLLGGGAAAVYAWNRGRYAEWRTASDRLDAEVANGNTGPAAANRGGALRNDAVDIQRMNDLAIGLAIGAGATLVASGALWATTF